MTFPRARAAIDVGFEKGWHVGVQLAVWRNGEPVVDFAQGIARENVAMATDSLMPWFSCTKLVTAVAIAQLVERNQLHLDRPVVDVVPEFAPHGKDTITLRHVLTHTGGFRKPAGADELFTGGVDPTALFQQICDAPLEWAPGTRAGYHPVTGFHLLGEMIRRVDGRAPEDFIAEEIFEPLGMADAWLALSPERVAAYGDRIGVMHDTTVQPPKPYAPRYYTWPLPSSSGIGPFNELVRVAEALRQGGALDGERILSPDAVALLTARHRVGMKDETFGAVIDWGLGVMVNSIQYTGKPAPYGYGDHASTDAFGHGGQQSSIVFADPGAGLSVALCCNGMAGEPVNHRRTQPVLTALYEDLAPTI
ncbi:MAG: serine hydrolase domain-containing protein [Acidimicrobiales bacterium]|nr:serine hydrolase domain-containing protein [Acidimicrobiales bacterium]